MVKKILSSLAAGLVAFAIVFAISNYTNLFLGLDRGILNGLFYLREPSVGEANPFVSDRVKLLGYDENAIAVIGKWPWKRHVHAEFLRKIQKFSPETVFFDLIFAKPETMPDFVRNRLEDEPEVLEKVKTAFDAMDGSFAAALAASGNVYLDLQLIEEHREGLPAFFRDRIRFNEKIIEQYSLPAGDVTNPVVFNSLEPILSDYVRHAHPVVINVLPDDDGVVRMFPVYYTYRMTDGSFRNVFTVVLALLQRYYHIDKSRVLIQPDRVVLKGARVPAVDGQTGLPVRSLSGLPEVAQRVSNAEPPAGYTFNDNLYRLLVHQMRNIPPDENKIPHFPLEVLQSSNGELLILDGWEIFQAAKDAGAHALLLSLFQERDIDIETPVPGFFLINYAGKDEQFYMNPGTGEMTLYRSIPTESYHKVYAMEEMPDVPALNTAGKAEAGTDTQALENWFVRHCRIGAETVLQQAARELGEEVQDEQQLIGYMNEHPEKGQYFFYSAFFDALEEAGKDPGEGLAHYAEFGRQFGQAPDYFLSREKMVAVLMDAWSAQFDNYYNKFIFTGGNATGLGDVQNTPYARMFGVNVIINAFNTVATLHPLRMSWDIPLFDVALLAGLCLVCSLLYGMAGIRISGLLFALSLLGTFIGSLGVFVGNNLFVSTTPLVLANAVVFISLMIFKLLTEEKDKKFIKETFGAYLAPELIHEMHQSKAMPRLGGEAKVITAFFTDIQSFSTFSEKLTAHQLVELLNEYLTAMTDILIHEKGTLDKYEGDAIIAFFGAPMDLPDQEVRACRVAVNMQQKLDELRRKWEGEKVAAGELNPNLRNVPTDQWIPGDRWPLVVHQMRMRIGINTGEIVVGNMGSTMRMNYTMMGDSVNLAARLEAAAKQYGVYNLLSEYTLDVEFIDEEGEHQKVMDLVETRFLDHITVVGKSEPVKVYELIAMKGELADKEQQLIALFEEGMALYRDTRWDNAIEKFSQSYTLERFPFEKTNPSEVFIQRCREFKQHPPVAVGEKWDGVFRLTKK